MGQVVTIGLDIAKSVFQVHGVDSEGGVVIRQKLTRARLLKFFGKLDPCLVGIEVCGTSHHWARELIELGHDVRLMPPSYVKPYVKRQKNDMADAEAICEAVTRPTMRFVPVKSTEQQSVMVLHRTRSILIRQRIQISNAIRSHMAEFGMAAAVGRQGLLALITVVEDSSDPRVPAEARGCLGMLAAQLRLVNEQILDTDRLIRTNARSTEVGRRLMEIRAWVRYWPALWSVQSPIRGPSRPAVTWRPGSASSRDRTPAAARSGSAGSPSRAIDTCGRCWSSAP